MQTPKHIRRNTSFGALRSAQPVIVPLTATADGLTTGLIPEDAYDLTVEAAAQTTDANDIITLPNALKGMSVTVLATVACEVRTTAASNETINGVDSDGTNELALAAGNVYYFVCVGDGAWIAYGWSAAGAALATLTPDPA